MSLHRSLKNPGEKLVHIDVRFDGCTISSIHISGDFFMYPEEAVYAIEKALIGCAADRKLIEHTIAELIENQNIELVGISASTIAQGIVEAFETL